MASITITNISSLPVFLTDFYQELLPGAAISAVRSSGQLTEMYSLHRAQAQGLVSVLVDTSDEEDGSGFVPILGFSGAGTTAERPASPQLGHLFYNTTTSSLEVWNGVAWASVGGGTAPEQVKQHLNMPAVVTAVDGAQGVTPTVSRTPVGTAAAIHVTVNGVQVAVGDGVTTLASYFSGNAGATARAFGSVVIGDTWHWNGSIAGYQLATTDRVSWIYTALP